MRTVKKFTILFAVALLLVVGAVVSAQDDVTLRMIIHSNPPYNAFLEEFNAAFEEANPGITIDMSIVAPGDLGTVLQTRLAAGDLDFYFRLGAFDNAVQPFMTGAVAPSWQTQIEAGLILDLTGQEFLGNYDDATIAAGTVNGGVYQVSLGRVVYSGIFVNESLFEEFGVAIPTTWEELIAACDTFTSEGIGCMTAGGADGWPIFVGAYGLHGALFPDQQAYVEGLWTGDIAYNDEANLVMWERMQTYAQDMIEPGASGIPADAAPGRFSSGAVAMLPGGAWMAPAIADSEPDFEWSYIPFPGSSVAEDNEVWFGKYDLGFEVAASTPNQEAVMLYLEAFSDPENYNNFINAVGFIPTQPTALLEGTLGESLAPYLSNFLIGFEQYWVAPTGTGQWAVPWANHFAPYNQWEDAAALADQAQADLQSGLDAVSGE